MRLFNRDDFFSAIFCLIIGGIVLYTSKDFPKLTGHVYGGGPAFYPQLLSIVLIFLGFLLFAKGISQPRKDSFPVFQNVRVEKKKYIIIVLIVVSSIFLNYFMNYLGFYLLSCVFLIGSMILIKPNFKKKDLLIYCLITAGILLSIYVIFELLFHVQLPRPNFLFFKG